MVFDPAPAIADLGWNQRAFHPVFDTTRDDAVDTLATAKRK
jgi:hypothetical protein